MAYVFILLLIVILWLAFRNKKNGPIRNRNNDWPVSDSGNSYVSADNNNDTGNTEFGGGEFSGGGADGSWGDGGGDSDSGDSGGDGGGDGGGD